MLELLGALAVLASAQGGAIDEKDKDPMVCRGDRSSVTTGSHVRRQKKVCKLKSQWALEEKEAQRELQQVRDRWMSPGRADKGR
jgi:hypothetical protein